MGATLNPYLSFRDAAREAMEFYQSIFGGNLTFSTFGEFGMDDPAAKDLIMHAQLVTDSGFTLMASDAPPGMAELGEGEGRITVSLSGTDENLRDYWAKLAEGATVTMPFEKQMWGDEYGQLTDKFGVPWMVDLVGDPGGGAEGSAE